jgi:hypothetical protein
METQVQPMSRKSELRDKIRALEAERSVLENEINVLKEKVEVRELEVYTSSLENEVGTLRVEKTILEERATISTPYTPYAVEEVTSTPSISALETPDVSEETPELMQTDGIVQPITSDTTTSDSIE